MPSTPPAAPRKPTTLPALHDRRRSDDYAWLKDGNWQQVMRDPAVLRADIREYLEAENAYKETVLAPTEALRAALFDEFRGRIREDDSSVPAKDGAWEYYQRFREGGQHPVVCRRPAGSPARSGAGGATGGLRRHAMGDSVATGEERGDATEHAEEEFGAGATDSGGASEQILLDGDAEAEGKSYYRIGGRGHSFDHRWFAWTVDENGSEFYTLRVKDLETGQPLDDVIERCSGGFVWAGDHQTVFYTVLDDNHRPCKVLRHRVGTDPAGDILVYEEPDSGFFLNTGLTESRRFVVIDAHDHVTSEVRLVDAARPDTAPVLVARRDPMTEYDVSHHGDRLIILTNAGGAEDFRIVEAPVASPGREHWIDLVPHRPGILIVGFEVYARWLVRLERENALPRIVVRDLTSGEEHAIAFEEEAYSLGLAGGYEFDTDTLRFTYSSMTTPEHVYDYDMRTRERVVRKVQEVPSGHDPADYVTRRIMAASHDGEAVPVSVLHRKDTAIDGTAPLLLYGYGSYGMSMPASFGTTRLSLVGPRLRLRHRARARRHRAWLRLVHRRQAREEDQHLPRLHRGRAHARRARVHPPRPYRHPRRQRRRTARRRVHQHGAGAVPRRRRRSAVRRRAQHHLRRHAPAHPAGMAGVGQPDRERGGLRLHRRLQPLRQRRSEGVPAHHRHRGPHRPARHLLGAGEVGGEAARDEDR